MNKTFLFMPQSYNFFHYLCRVMEMKLILRALLLLVSALVPGVVCAAWPGQGSAASPYLLRTRADLDSLAARGAEGETFDSLCFRLDADIDSVSGMIPRFSGHLDGAGHSLTLQLKAEADTAALFRVIGEEGSVSRLVLKGSVEGSRYVGALAGDCRGVADSIVNETSVKGRDHVAGIAAIASGTLRRCINRGQVSGASYVAGIACKLPDKGVLAHCSNDADLLLPRADNVAGVLCYTVVRVNRSRMARCANTGAIAASEYGAGIAARCEAGLRLDSCSNSGSVSVSGRYSGGVVAVATGDPIYKVSLTGCSNLGTVSGGENYLGGIVGFTSGNVALDSCVNAGPVLHTGTTGGAWVGGLCGMTFGTLDRCANIAPVSAPHCYGVGGIAGAAQSGARLSQCYNTGAVTASIASGSGNYGIAGGLVGDARHTTFNNCYNLGTVSAGMAVGGLCGMLHAGCALRRSYTAGQVTATAIGASALASAVANIEADAVPATLDLYYDADVCTRLSAFDREYATGLTTRQMCQTPPSELYDSASWCYPLLLSPAPLPQAVIASACVGYTVAGDNADNVNGNLLLGQRPGLTWRTDRYFELIPPDVAMPMHRGAGTLTLSLPADFPSAATLSRTFLFTIRSHHSTVSAHPASPLAIRYYTPTGLPVAHPAPGQLLLRVTLNPDGTLSTAKLIY